MEIEKHTESGCLALSVLRSYVVALDVAGACQALPESVSDGFEAFNFVAKKICIDISVADLLQYYCPQITNILNPHGTHQTPVDSSKLRRGLGWKAHYDWKELRNEYQKSVK